MSDVEWLQELRERAPTIAAKFAEHLGEGSTILVEPGCPKGCPRCTRECAVRYIVAGWWTREHAKAELEARSRKPTSKTREGVIYSPLGELSLPTHVEGTVH